MPTSKWKTPDGKERESRVVSNYKLPKSNGLIDADGKRWYNAINPGIDTSIGSAIMFGPGILSRLVAGGDRDEAMPFEEQLWKAYTTGETGDLIKPSKYRFEGDGDDDAQYIQVPQEQALLIQAIADEALVYGRGLKARSLDHPELVGYESSRRNVKEDLDVAKAIMENPGEWVQVNEGNSPMTYKKETKDGKDSFNYSGLGGFKNFSIRWLPEEGYLEVKDDYDFRRGGVEGVIPSRDIPIKIRDRIKFDPKKGSVLRNDPSKLESKGYIQRYGLSDKDIKEGVSEYEKDPDSTYNSLIEKFDDGGEVDGGFDEWYRAISSMRGLTPDPDDRLNYYDYRRFYRENRPYAEGMRLGDLGSHFYDTYKLPGHPTFSTESLYNDERNGIIGGRWIEKDGKIYYYPSDYTKDHFNRTLRYLAGSGEGIIKEIKDGDIEYIMPERREMKDNFVKDQYNDNITYGDKVPDYDSSSDKMSRWKGSHIDWDKFTENWYSMKRKGSGLDRKINKENMDFILDELLKLGYEGDRLYVMLANILEESGGDPKTKRGEYMGLFQESTDRYTEDERKRDEKLSDKEVIINTLRRVDGHIKSGKNFMDGGIGSGFLTGADAKDTFMDVTAPIEDVSRAFVYGFESPKDSRGTYINRTNVAKILSKMMRDTDRAKGLRYEDNTLIDRINPKRMDDGGLVEKQDHIYERLTDEYDIPPLQAVAIVANLTHESGLRDDVLGDSGASFGIQQWKGDRRKKLESFAKSRYHEVPTLDDQVDFLMGEYNTNAFQFKNQGKNLYASGVVSNPIFDYYQYSKYDFDNASNLYDATIAWNQGVGRPNKKYAYNERRYEIAKGIAERHGVDIGGDSHYTEMGYNVLPDLLVQAPDKSFRPAEDIPSQKEREDKYMAEYGNDMLADLLSYGSGSVNIHVVNPQIPSQNISGDEAAEMKRLELQNRREQQKRLLEAVLPNIGLNIPNLSK